MCELSAVAESTTSVANRSPDVIGVQGFAVGHADVAHLAEQLPDPGEPFDDDVGIDRAGHDAISSSAQSRNHWVSIFSVAARARRRSAVPGSRSKSTSP